MPIIGVDEGVSEQVHERGWKGGREGEREGEREGGREGGRERKVIEDHPTVCIIMHVHVDSCTSHPHTL